MQKRKCTLWIKLLGHISCLAMESHAAKLPVHSFCADVNARGDVYLHSYSVSRLWANFVLCAAFYNPAMLAVQSWNMKERQNYGDLMHYIH